MRSFPLSVWHSPDGSGSARFSVGAFPAPSETPSKSAADPLESLRCDVIIALSDRLTSAAITHPHLAPFLMDGLDNALERLGRLGHEHDLHPIQQWLSQEQGEA